MAVTSLMWSGQKGFAYLFFWGKKRWRIRIPDMFRTAKYAEGSFSRLCIRRYSGHKMYFLLSWRYVKGVVIAWICLVLSHEGEIAAWYTWLFLLCPKCLSSLKNTKVSRYPQCTYSFLYISPPSSVGNTPSFFAYGVEICTSVGQQLLPLASCHVKEKKIMKAPK